MIDVLPEIRPLLAEDRPIEFVATPNLAAKPLLQELARALPKKARDRAFASACMAGLWLRHDFLDESHAISQELDTAEGSYWHALMHRREPDYGNSKYWFRRVGQHPIFGDLQAEALQITMEQRESPPGCDFLIRQEAWDPFAFVDFCEAAMRSGDHGAQRLSFKIQGCEFWLLFRYCHERAFAKEPRTK
jgi:hypothetical protein